MARARRHVQIKNLRNISKKRFINNNLIILLLLLSFGFKHSNVFSWQPYMKRFEENLQELDLIFNHCLTNFIDCLALYPQNEKLAELKTRYKHFFTMFGEPRPIKKSLSNICGNQMPDKRVEVNDYDSKPSFSLGLSHMFPKILGDALDTCVVTPKTLVPLCKRTNDRSETGMLQEPVKGRPRRDIIPVVVCRSPYVTRLTDTSQHILPAEEKDV